MHVLLRYEPICYSSLVPEQHPGEGVWEMGTDAGRGGVEKRAEIRGKAKTTLDRQSG